MHRRLASSVFAATLALSVLAAPTVRADACAGLVNGYWCSGSNLLLCIGGSISTSQNCTYGCHFAPVGQDDYCEPAPSGPCNGKANGYWCDGSNLLLCQGGGVSSSQNCQYGCYLAPAGTDDYCNPAPSGPCSGLANGYWCDGSTLLLCSGGGVSSSQSCQYGCYSAPAGTDDYCNPAPSGPCSGLVNGYWCDGNDLLLCQNGAVSTSQTCQYGCFSAAAGTDDYCNPAPSGPCAGKVDGYWCDGSDDLVLCVGGGVSTSQSCPNGCFSAPAGTDDYCNPGASGPCAGKVDGYWCDGTDDLVLCVGGAVSTSQGCPNGCFSAPAGTDDYCNPGAAGACAGKVDGYWCDGTDDLVLCVGGAVSTSQGCPNGCLSAPAGTDDYCNPGSSDFCAALQNGYWCEGNALVLCAGGQVASSAPCPTTCISAPLGTDDYCASGNPGCQPNITKFPVNGPHNTGWDPNATTYSCPPHPASAPENSDYSGHYGLDIFAAKGTPVVACVTGTVGSVSTADVGDGGLNVYLTGPCGWTYYYAHLDSVAAGISPGVQVSAGTLLGTVGNTGNAAATSWHLHFSVYYGDYYDGSTDPFPLVQAVDATSCDAGGGGCGNACVVGSHACLNDATEMTCVQGGAGCGEWQNAACGAGAKCFANACVTCAVAGQVCGLDACGQLVGTCPTGTLCNGATCVTATSGQNPTPSEVHAAIAQLVLNYPISWTGKNGNAQTAFIPTRIVKAVAWQESGWSHYAADGNVLQGSNGTSTDYGIMQVNGPNGDATMLGMSWFDNLDRGIKILRDKWTALAYSFEDPSLLENWYFPLAAYNGLLLDGVNDPSSPGPTASVAYYQAHPELIANRLTYQDRIYGIVEAPSEWPVNAFVRSQGKLEDITGRLVRPYAIPGWITSGVSWSAQGYTWVRPYTSEADSFGKPAEAPALHSYGFVLHRWVEDANGGHVELVSPPQGNPGAGDPSVNGWKSLLQTPANQPVPYAGTVESNGATGISALRFVIGTVSGDEDVQTFTFSPALPSVPLGSYAFDPGKYGGQPGSYFVGLWASTPESGFALLDSAVVSVSGAGFVLTFPVAGYTAWNAPINSVFDHAMGTRYSVNGSVVAYTGEIASGTPCIDYPCSYVNPTGKPYKVNGNYTGAYEPTKLWYEGHPGIDYNFGWGTVLRATAAGTVSNPQVGGGNTYNILQIDHANGYVTQYWHCATHTAEVGDFVSAGDPVATVGEEGAPGAYHLHLEILKDGVSVDPYGWTGSGSDPYTAATNINLWGTPPAIGGAIPCLTQCLGNTLCAGEQCLLLCTSDADCPDNGVCLGGLCAPECAGQGSGACLGEEQGQIPPNTGGPDAGGADAGPDPGGVVPPVSGDPSGCGVGASSGANQGWLLLFLLFGLLAVRRRYRSVPAHNAS